MTNTAVELRHAIETRTATVAVLGMGYVGLPLAMAAHDAGFRVIGFDVDPGKVEKLNRGQCYIQHIRPGKVAEMAASGHFRATTQEADLAAADVLLICVPTPLTKQREPDMRFVDATTETVARILRPGQLVVLESTTYPGTTDERLKPRLEAAFLAGRPPHPTAGETPGTQPAPQGGPCGRDFFLAFSPEREDPGNKDFGTTNTPKVVGGVDGVSGDLAEAFYATLVQKVVRVRDARTAEAAKLTENVFRAVNIALVNELKILYDRMGIDVWEVLDAAATKPFGFMRFNPGPGWGGHCIPLDPFYLTWKAREFGLTSDFIEHAGKINRRMPEYVLEKLMAALNERGKCLRGSKVLVLGVAYKKDIDDPRESPAFEILDLLLRHGAQVSYHDPHIPVLPKMREWPHLPNLESTPLSPSTLQNHDAALLVTDHTAVDYAAVLAHAPLIVDTRGVFRGRNGKVVRA
ncbi:MAG: nucleotide sugar dehydrogenase [Acidobacteriota bacterium]